MAAIVLDSSAIIAMLEGEPGAEIVRSNLQGALISAVNLTEVGTKLLDRGSAAQLVRAILDRLSLETASFDPDQAWEAAVLRNATRQYGLSLGDRACLALAAARKLPVLTTDRAWARLNIGVEIRLARGAT